MKKSFLAEYAGYWLARAFGLLVISLPLKANYTLGKSIGLMGYYLLKKKRRLALKNLKTAFAQRFKAEELEQIAKKAFISLALDIIEILYIPKIDSRYINKHIRIENLGYLDQAIKKGQGVIFLAYHLGNWELANITCALQGYDYKVIVNQQRYPLLNGLLTRYRESKGCKTIPRGIALREALKALKRNQVVAMVGDQGGKEGELVDLFGIPTPAPTGFVRFALSAGSAVIPAIIVRERRFSHRIILEKPIRPDRSKSNAANIENCLLESNAILERYISEYPQEYFWFYKIWKYSPLRKVVVLNDGKAGHLMQAKAVLKIVAGRQSSVASQTIDIKFKNRAAKLLAQVCAALDIDIMEFCLAKETYFALLNTYADLVISCGGSSGGINLFLARENLAQSVCIMKPGLVNPRRFNLLIVPKHDRARGKKNTIQTLGALNLIDEGYLEGHSQKLKAHIRGEITRPVIGLLAGGDTRRYVLTLELIRQVVLALKSSCLELNLDILATTSRRTPARIEQLLKEELGDFKECRLLVIANEKNIPEAVGGILGLAELVIVSGESISMVSEAAASGKYVLVFRLAPRKFNLKTRHEEFLRNLEDEGYIYIVEPENIAGKIKDILSLKPPVKRLNDQLKVKEAIERLL